MRNNKIYVIFLIAVVVMVTCGGIAFADSGLPAVPEIQGLSTGTGINALGTVTESDSVAWTTTNDPDSPAMLDFTRMDEATINLFDADVNQLLAAGGSISGSSLSGDWIVDSISIPVSLLDQPMAGSTPLTWADEVVLLRSPFAKYSENDIPEVPGGIHGGILDPHQVQYTTGYNDQYSGISGQQTFTKSLAISTANKAATASNIKANTNIQYIAVNTGRATRSEDLLIDGAGNSTDTASSILCPFAASVSTVIPPYCTIVQAGSAFDTTLTSTVTSADTRFVGTDSTFPVVLNYNINSEGLTVGDQSSPMIGSVSAYLKVHVQESRNVSTIPLPAIDGFPPVIVDQSPEKSEDLTYSETSSASGLISKFSKSMSYQSGFNLI
jgi:hypothetical protein